MNATANVRTLPRTNFEFGKVVGNLELANLHLNIARSALNFVRRGLFDLTSRHQSVCIGGFEAMVTVALMHPFDDPWAPPTKASQRAAFEAFHRAFLECSEYLFGKIAPPWIGGAPTPLEAASAKAVLGLAPLDEPAERAPLRQAYLMARFNHTRCEQRIAVLHLLANLVRGQRNDLPEPAQSEFDQASARFFHDRQVHTARLLGMGVLLGGEALEECRAFVKNQYREGISIMELLECDGIHPGQYLSRDEERFRKALDKA